MAGGKVIVRKKINASTILEVLISMIVIMVVFGIAMMIFTNIIKSSPLNKKISAENILNDLLINDETSAVPVTQTLSVGEFTIQQDVKPYSGSILIEVDLTAYDESQQKISELHKVILTKDE